MKSHCILSILLYSQCLKLSAKPVKKISRTLCEIQPMKTDTIKNTCQIACSIPGSPRLLPVHFWHFSVTETFRGNIYISSTIMSRSLADLLGRSIAGFLAGRSITVASGCFYRCATCYSTTMPHDPDTHEDFRPTTKLEGSGLSLNDIVEQDVKENPVMIYMKGVPDLPRGFSSLAVRVLKEYRNRGSSSLSTQNEKIHKDLSMQKQKLNRLRKKL